MALPEPTSLRAPGASGADAAPGAAGRCRRGGSPHLPARRRARPRQDRPGAARRAGGRRLSRCSSSCRTSSRPTGQREADLWTPQRPATVIHGDGDDDRRLRRHRHRQLRGARPARRLAGGPRLPRHGRRRGALHQEQVLAALAARAAALRADPRPHRPAAADGADRHPADQRHRGLPARSGSSSAGSTTRSRWAS